MKKTREKIQLEALNILKKNNYNGVICLSTGSGKSKVAINAIKEGTFKNILITSPRTNLKENWRDELNKWGFANTSNPRLFCEDNKEPIYITLENIQTAYKWNYDQFKQFDLIIADEIHTTATDKYGNLIYNARNAGIPIIGLTATPDNDKEEKAEFYAINCPIIYEYYDSARDGIINKRKHLIFQYELNDKDIVTAGTKKKPYQVGEAKQYTYLTEQIRKGQRLMAATGSEEWWKDSIYWFYQGHGDFEQKTAARIYLQGIKYRKEFLWNLTSSANYALQIKKRILSKKEYINNIRSINLNKILLFSENIKQAQKLSEYSVHSNQDSETNKQLLHQLDEGKIRELSSVRTLTLGLNIKGVNYIIRESFNGSEVNMQQLLGRRSALIPLIR